MIQMSVLMPVYNAERYVAAAVESVLAQTFRDFEFIIVDDGSTDDSLAILKKLATEDSRIRLISRPNTGIVGALNDGLAAAQGQFIARMDADDLCLPNRFELQLARFHSEPDLILVGSCASMIDPDGRALGSVNVPLAHEDIERLHLRGSSCIFHPAVLMRANVVRDVGGYRLPAWPSEDLDLWLRLGEKGRLANLSEPLFIWRQSLGSIISRNRSAVRTALPWVMLEAWNRRAWTGARELPSVKIESLGVTYRRWGWLALRNGHIGCGRRYGIKSVLAEPGCWGSWSLMLHSIKGCVAM